ncbi:hypothetical protein ACVBEQ_01345 [Nakamurella sp. GG22]
MYAFYYDVPGTPEMYQLVSRQLGSERPDGLVVQLVTTTESGLRHLNVWQSREQWEQFRDGRVRPAVAAVLATLRLPQSALPPDEHPLALVDVGTATSGPMTTTPTPV